MATISHARPNGGHTKIADDTTQTDRYAIGHVRFADWTLRFSVALQTRLTEPFNEFNLSALLRQWQHGCGNPSEALRNLDHDEKGLSSTDTPSGFQDMLIVSESGMYTLVLRCRDAVKCGTVPYRFRRWVTREVLPSIRKTGRYESAAQPIDPDRIDLVRSY